MDKVKFCFGIHNHQPVGNFGWVIEEAYQKSYLPFLELVDKYPSIRFTLHFTGVLFDWIKKHHPECFDLIQKLQSRNQLELMTGGFFEPILPAIPDRDKIGQIRMQSDFIEKEFGVRPSGMWLAERVWEPGLPTPLKEASVRYTILDDIHFRYAGLEEAELDGYYITEDQGNSLALFPIAKRLRYTIPFADPEETISYIQNLATESGNRLAIYADDGEKFGVWPQTYEHCFINCWLERFFRALTDNLDWIEMLTFGEALQQLSPRGRVYLPTASYSEMNEWAMPVRAIEQYDDFVHLLKDQQFFERYEAFVKGGFWRNFQTKYSESNQLHKRMLYVSSQLESNMSAMTHAQIVAAQRHLYAGQCNCPYWHGVFGGLYLPHLRGAVYEEIITSEKFINEARESSLRVEQLDFDCDGNPEIIVTTPYLKAIVAPGKGGVITELDHFPTAKNLVDVVGRRKEGYHKKLLGRHEPSQAGTKSIHDLVLVKEEGLERLLTEDLYPKGLFYDHFLDDSASLSDFEFNRCANGTDFYAQEYIAESHSSTNSAKVTLRCNSDIRFGARTRAVEITKTFSFQGTGEKIHVHYEITNHSDSQFETIFGCEMAFGSYPFPATESLLILENNSVAKLDPNHDLKGCANLSLYSKLYQLLLSIQFNDIADVWTHPLWTVSLSEGGFERVFQGTIVLPRWRVQLPPGGVKRIEFVVETAVVSQKDLTNHKWMTGKLTS